MNTFLYGAQVLQKFGKQRPANEVSSSVLARSNSGIARLKASGEREIANPRRRAGHVSGLIREAPGPFSKIWRLEEARRAKALGFQGKSCIHPVQIAAANEAFQPSGSEVAFSRKVVKAWREAAIMGRGAIVVDGIMIDTPYAANAEAVLLQAQRFAAIKDVEA